MSDNLDKHLNRYYQKKTLAPEVMQRLLDIQAMQTGPNTSESVPLLRRAMNLFAGPGWLAALAMLLLVLLVPVFMLNNSGNQHQELLGNIAAEVAMNHNKRLPSDFVTDSYSELTTMMDKLDFSLIKPPHNLLNGYQLTGARYCSLQGQIAGQLKLTNEAGEQHTLYVTRLSDKFSELQESQREIDGLSVSNWQSGGLFFSLAQ